MTMFSMKPKFNLPEFLAESARGNGSKSAGGRAKGRQFRRAPTPEAAAKPSTDDATDAPAAEK